MANHIEIDLSTLVFVHRCGDGALFVDGAGDKILFRATGTEHDLKAATRELLKAAKAVEAR